jgi:hypothetical protein
MPPQVSSPQLLPEHCGVQHEPAAVHRWPPAQPQSAAQLLQFSPGSQRMLPQKTSG